MGKSSPMLCDYIVPLQLSEVLMTQRATSFLLSCLSLALFVLPVSAQVSLFSGNLAGANEVPAVSPAGTGTFSATYDPSSMTLTVNGTFSGMTSNVSACHIHDGAAGSNGGVVFGMTCTSGTSGTIVGSGTLSAAQVTDLFANGLYVNVHTPTNPGGEIRAQVNFVATIDGNLTEAGYMSLATKQNSNASFGPNTDVTEIVVLPDNAANMLCVGLKSVLDNGTNNGIGLWLDFSELTGAAAGTALGGSPGGHYMGGNGGSNASFQADFEVDYMLAYNPGTDASNNFVDLVSLVGGRNAEFLGNTGQSGATVNNEGGVFSAGSVRLAFQNGGGNQGLELCAPYSELGITSAGSIAAFAFVVSSTAFFSDVTVPGNITTGQPGFDTNFGSLSGGPYNSSQQVLPVELTAFDALVDANKVMLAWQTASELNNSGFAVEHAEGVSPFGQVTFVTGRGTTSEATTYSYQLDGLPAGLHRFRLKQIDFDGMFTYSPTLSVAVGVPSALTLDPVYPNPFNPTATVRFAVQETQPVSVAVYNVLGQQVQVLFDGIATGGTAQMATLDGSALPGGLYFVRMTGPSMTVMQAVTLLK